MRNIERIQKMSAEDLAKVMRHLSYGDTVCDYCTYGLHLEKCQVGNNTCFNGIKECLLSEAEDE